MALTTYTATPVSGSGVKGSYIEIVASTPYDSSRLHVIVTLSSAASMNFAFDIATGAVSSESIIIPNILTSNTTISGVIGYPLAFDVDIPAGTRLSTRCQSTTASSSITAQFFLEDRALASIVNPVTYGVSGALGTTVDPGATVSTKGAYVELTSSTSIRIDALVVYMSTMGGGTAIAAYQAWFVDIATGAAASETIIISDVRVDCSPNDDWARPFCIRFPFDIPAGTRISARCSCTVNTATQRNLKVAITGMQEPTPATLFSGESIQFSVVRPD